MKPIEILTNEHKVIKQVLSSLEKMAAEFEEAGKIDVVPAAQAIDFFRNFADRCHHGKEEARLFPLMEERGIPRDGGPTGVMLIEHDQGRAHVGAMNEAVEAEKAGREGAAERFANAALSFVDLLRAHIDKEDHCLFSMADNVLTEDDQLALSIAFEKVEREDIGEGVHERYLKIADELAAKYGVAVQPREAVHCCGH